MRVLFLLRQRQGGLSTLCRTLARELDKWGVEAVVDDVADLVPDETSWLRNRSVKKKLLESAKGFDLVHAWGYRLAWACSESFYVHKPWVYTAHELPKTTAAPLIDRMNASRAGACSSRAILETLETGDAMNLHFILPGVSAESQTQPRPDREQVRMTLGLSPEQPVVLFLGRDVPEHGLSELIDSFAYLANACPNAHLLAVTDTERSGVNLTLAPGLTPAEAYAAADIVAVPGQNRGSSLVAMEAMARQKCVVTARADGLRELGFPGTSRAVYDENTTLAQKLIELCLNVQIRESIAYAGQVWSHDEGSLNECARRYAQLYRDIL